MTQSTIAPGIYTFFVGHDGADNRNRLYAMHFDGVTMGSPTPWIPSGDPELIGSPCCVYDAKCHYSSPPHLHIFILAKAPEDEQGNVIWWLTTKDGVSFTTHRQKIENVSTGQRFGAVMMKDGIHLYYTDLKTGRIAHSWSREGWHFNKPELLLTENDTAAWGVAAVQADKLYLLFGNGNGSIQPQNNLRLFCQEDGTDPNQPSGSFTDRGPDPALNIRLHDTPGATMLGTHLHVLYKHHGEKGQKALLATMSAQGNWKTQGQIPDAWTTNSIGSCLYGGRLFCLFQSSGGSDMYLQAYIGRNWLPSAIKVVDHDHGPSVYWGPAVVAVERDLASP